ncbi:hypothetical protein SAMN06264867_11347 [Halorubrum cibi]|uniref:Uncharacterized protein n=1 Tax=Halorubrum cibi TaxID=413815 RepID=A0A521EX53_9EURY|nr:hypothetical protein SAMN06264867_11347 [Halorubrum cibi]
MIVSDPYNDSLEGSAIHPRVVDEATTGEPFLSSAS